MIDIIAKLIIALAVSIYYIQRIRKYIANRKNNNVTGDVLIRWESVSLIDKYHIRERFFGGSRLRIKRDPKRREIKYYYVAFIPALVFILFSLKIENTFVYVSASVCLLIIIGLLFDKIEYKKAAIRLVVGIFEMLLALLAYIYMSANVYNIKEISHIYKKFMLKGKDLGIGIDLYIPLIVIALLFIFSIIKKRSITFVICICALLTTCLSVGISGFPSASNYLLIYFVGYLYVTLIALQYIYNVRALKKITFIN